MDRKQLETVSSVAKHKEHQTALEYASMLSIIEQIETQIETLKSYSSQYENALALTGTSMYTYQLTSTYQFIAKMHEAIRVQLHTLDSYQEKLADSKEQYLISRSKSRVYEKLKELKDFEITKSMHLATQKEIDDKVVYSHKYAK